MTSDLEDALPSLRSQEGGSGGGRRLLLRLPDALQPGAGSASGGGAAVAETLAMAQLVPVRAAMRGSFPLAGTYFQVLVVDTCVSLHIILQSKALRRVACTIERSSTPTDSPKCRIFVWRRSTRCSWTSTPSPRLCRCSHDNSIMSSRQQPACQICQPTPLNFAFSLAGAFDVSQQSGFCMPSRQHACGQVPRSLLSGARHVVHFGGHIGGICRGMGQAQVARLFAKELICVRAYTPFTGA